MPREIVAASKVRTAIVEVLRQKRLKEGHYGSINQDALRGHVRSHLGLGANQEIRDKEWKEAIALAISANQIRRNPNQSLVFTPPPV